MRNFIYTKNDLIEDVNSVFLDMLYLPISVYSKLSVSSYYRKLDRFLSKLEKYNYIVVGDSVKNSVSYAQKYKVNYNIDIYSREYSNKPIMRISISSKCDDEIDEILYTYDNNGKVIGCSAIRNFNMFRTSIIRFINYLELTQHEKLAGNMKSCLYSI